MTQIKRPVILISNDDGYQAKGINDLTRFLREIGDIIVVAPDSARSGASMSVSSHNPVRINLVSKEKGLTVYTCTGTPSDCVKIALEKILPEKPDVVVGGINHGDNSSISCHYSGTVAIVLEATIKSIPAVAFSSMSNDWNANFENMKPYIQNVVKYVLEEGLAPNVCLNVNFPATDDFKGMKVCRMAMGDWKNEWEEHQHPRGWNYFWLTGYFESNEKEMPDTDVYALSNGYASLTPIQIDMTAYQMLDKLSVLNDDKKQN